MTPERWRDSGEYDTVAGLHLVSTGDEQHSPLLGFRCRPPLGDGGASHGEAEKAEAPPLDVLWVPTHTYRIKCFGSPHAGQPCRILARGGGARGGRRSPSNVLIEFGDGTRLVTTWRGMRRLR